ncbi:hypothetical protein [Streptomyces sp. SM10]|uniref:hypothetical protein n=1 Tax=Streptomyces sp. SM10 TaxID=565556 RepID=UPI0015E176F7
MGERLDGLPVRLAEQRVREHLGGRHGRRFELPRLHGRRPPDGTLITASGVVVAAGAGVVIAARRRRTV